MEMWISAACGQKKASASRVVCVSGVPIAATSFVFSLAVVGLEVAALMGAL